jgi:DNA-binding response OmpR family regulator
MNGTICVVEDEPDILSIVTTALRRERYSVREFADGRSFLEALPRQQPLLVVLDLMLPDLDGFEICRRLKRDKTLSAIPIIILSARAQEADRVAGLELGADDYMVKPFSPRELVARVAAVLRRTGRGELAPSRLTAGPLAMDLDAMEVTLEGRKLEFTTTEFRLLQLFATGAGWVFSRERILEHLWGSEKSVTERSVDAHIKNLREKLGPFGSRIRSVRGMGYRLTGGEGQPAGGEA